MTALISLTNLANIRLFQRLSKFETFKLISKADFYVPKPPGHTLAKYKAIMQQVEYRKVGEKMAISINTAITHLYNAESRFHQ